MTTLNVIYYVLSMLIGVVAAGVPLVLKMRATYTAYKTAKTEGDVERANADLLATAKQFISAAEVAFDGFDKMMKSQGSSAGAMKKDNVFTKLQAYALQNGYEFDGDEWSKKIDELVSYTKSVNAKKHN